ncbi:HAD family hydrolase [Myceligenerans indicum]|uniref:Haloacid dehalogenase n=1 Tax=Myceligenerans indicum TaxID=2593663 RepID=A0ABS1LN16_9MICO|nr:HAD family hydrolase [Myceligenerans indicum]MBL0886952.1 hypothetical protein [Myceligenerans indicum]
MTQLTPVHPAVVRLDRIAGAIFDLDSVVATTASAHARDWTRMFDAAAYPATVQLIRDLRRHRVRTAIVAAGRHCEKILAAAGVTQLFDACVDGIDADRWGTPGGLGPTTFELAAQHLEVAPSRCAVVEEGLGEALDGLRDFGMVIGIDRTGDRTALLHEHGADAVVHNLTEVRLADPTTPPSPNM